MIPANFQKLEEFMQGTGWDIEQWQDKNNYIGSCWKYTNNRGEVSFVLSKSHGTATRWKVYKTITTPNKEEIITIVNKTSYANALANLSLNLIKAADIMQGEIKRGNKTNEQYH